MTMPEDELQQLWATYKAERTQEARNLLIENYLPLVKSVAERLHAKMPKEVELDDLMSEGVFGLMDAIETFDLDRGVKFETFSNQRIKGAILDKLRSLDWVPRLVRARRHKIEDAYKQFEIKYGRIPTDDELAGEMDLSLDEFLDLARSATATGIISLNRKYYETEGAKTVREIDVLEDGRIEDPAEHMQRQDIRDLVTRGLNQRERLVIVLYYYEEMTMKEIGHVLRLSESRVSQMHASILLRLQNQLGDRRQDFLG
ncbi:MAG: RNA polymerase subunit sigma-70 [Planctomycetes bacterium DG_58]|nr:MAG: RNA polymerase subunit sigma-70 [Planctomycetes bacterium DG_58]KPL01858.1 MAG: RNA polymerase subunit sigma-70 [Planctomycetes bacterium SM23_65]